MSNYKNPFSKGGKFYNPRITDTSRVTDASDVTEPRIMPRWAEQVLSNKNAEPIDEEGNIIIIKTRQQHNIDRTILPNQYQHILGQEEYTVLNNNDFNEFKIFIIYKADIYELYIAKRKKIKIFRVVSANITINVIEEKIMTIPNGGTYTQRIENVIHEREFELTDNLMFNCHGYTFLNGSFWIDNFEAEEILLRNYVIEQEDLSKANVLALYQHIPDRETQELIHSTKIKSKTFFQKKGDIEGIENTTSIGDILASYPNTSFVKYLKRQNQPLKLSINFGNTTKIDGFRIISEREEIKKFKKLYNGKN